MEHIINIGFHVNDKEIENSVKNAATKEILAEIKEMTERNYSGESTARKIFREECKKWIDEHKDEVLEAASEQLVKNLAKTKAVKERIDKLFGSLEEGETDGN